jgi:hypothetical protein
MVGEAVPGRSRRHINESASLKSTDCAEDVAEVRFAAAARRKRKRFVRLILRSDEWMQNHPAALHDRRRVSEQGLPALLICSILSARFLRSTWRA